MARPRKPTAILEANGAFDKNPQRRRQDLASNEPIGAPPHWLTDAEATIWRETVLIAPVGLFTAPDRYMLAQFCELQAKLEKRVINTTERNILTRLIAAMGMTPADRSRVSASPQKQENDPDNEFAN
jgi:phage terminase small subunit